ncbi:MAG: hypothetical protein V4460_15245 [Pseudomonadota bacterium]|jgi:hypothetical protein
MSLGNDRKVIQLDPQSDAYLQLAKAVRDALNVFISSDTAGHDLTPAVIRTKGKLGPADIDDRGADWPSDPMTLQEVKYELRLKEAQIVKLWHLYRFPAPCQSNGTYLFSRREVESWARSQPNPKDFAAVLRLRRKARIPSTRP